MLIDIVYGVTIVGVTIVGATLLIATVVLMVFAIKWLVEYLFS